MKKCTSKSEKLNRLSVCMLTMLLFGTASAQDYLNVDASKACSAGYSGTWIIGDVCDLGNRIDLKTDDAIDIQCDNQTGRWNIDFYEEPANADPNDLVSQATRYALCPGNGYLAKGDNGQPVLRCNYWEPASNVAKQLEFELQAITDPGIRNISWLTRELDNPNVVCGIAGRPEGDRDKGTGNNVVEN